MKNVIFYDTILTPIQKLLEGKAGNKAFCIQDQYYTFGQLSTRIQTIREKLAHTDEQYIGLIASDALDTYAAILAIWMEGKCYVPLHPLQPEARIRDIIHQVGIKTILNPAVSGTTLTLPAVLTPDLPDVRGKIRPMVPPDDQQPAYILFTSGSTGHPKGVPVTFRNVAAFIDAYEDMGIRLKEEDRCLQMFDLTFYLSVGSYLPALLHGACLYTVPPGSVKYQEVFRLMDTYHLTMTLMVPSVIHYLRPYLDEIEEPGVHHCLFCGEALSTDDAVQWQKAVPNARIWNVYGPTENTIFCTCYKMNAGSISQKNGIMSIGTAMKGTGTAVIGEDHQFLKCGEEGELCLSGLQLTPGYWQDEVNNRKAFFTHEGVRWYKTGDLCIEDDSHNLLYCGRKDSQIKIQGFRVELSEIESIARHFYKEEENVVAVPVTDDSGSKSIILVVEGEEKGTKDALARYLSQYLPAYMIPRQIMFLSRFPQNANNKIDRRKISEMITA